MWCCEAHKHGNSVNCVLKGYWIEVLLLITPVFACVAQCVHSITGNSGTVSNHTNTIKGKLKCNYWVDGYSLQHTFLYQSSVQSCPLYNTSWPTTAFYVNLSTMWLQSICRWTIKWSLEPIASLFTNRFGKSWLFFHIQFLGRFLMINLHWFLLLQLRCHCITIKSSDELLLIQKRKGSYSLPNFGENTQNPLRICLSQHFKIEEINYGSWST